MHGTCPKCGHCGTLDVRHASQVIGTQAFAALALKAVADVTTLSVAALVGKARHRRIVKARAVACDIMREQGDLSWPQIGSSINRDHSTALYYAGRWGSDSWVIKMRRKALRTMALS